MATTKEPTFEQLVKFVQDNQLNVFNEYSPEQNDNVETVFDLHTYIDENYNQLVMQWQLAQPWDLTVEQIQVIYDRAFEKLKTLKGNAEFYDYAIRICQRILNWKVAKIMAK